MHVLNLCVAGTGTLPITEDKRTLEHLPGHILIVWATVAITSSPHVQNTVGTHGT